MKKSIYYILFFLILSFKLFAEINNSGNKSSEKSDQTHNLYFGPEFLYSHFKVEEDFRKFSSNGFYGGLRVRYEFLKPWIFYYGTDLFASYGIIDLKLTAFDQEVYHDRESEGFGNIDVRLGYPLVNRATFVPFLGLGEYFNFKIGSGRIVHIEYFYISGGYRFRYDISPKFRIGQDSKFFNVISTTLKENFSEIRYHETDFWGCEVALPFIWLFSKSWSFQFEPYFLKLNFSSKENLFGGRLLFGYHF
ncbi:MAG: hypothetical protein KR126chlam4_00978 [Candidatus Anoxychlamydiales bacterium]|nr:hypothetical protein [Candidatus Anoxychlamydiales bacterium]